MTKDEQRKMRQVLALHRGTRASQARTFLRCESYMITMIDEIVREEQVAQGLPIRFKQFGLRLVYCQD